MREGSLGGSPPLFDMGSISILIENVDNKPPLLVMASDSAKQLFMFDVL